MKVAEFTKRLSSQGEHANRLAVLMKVLVQNDTIAIAPRGSNLVEIVQVYCRRKMFPVVDKRLGVVLGAEMFLHRVLRSELFRYHKEIKEVSGNERERDLCADRWLTDGMGYFISSMRERTIVVAQNYRPDRYDKDLFQIFDVDYTL
jgi:hypothetical protein